jgi:hypothetical protein
MEDTQQGKQRLPNRHSWPVGLPIRHGGSSLVKAAPEG